MKNIEERACRNEVLKKIKLLQTYDKIERFHESGEVGTIPI